MRYLTPATIITLALFSALALASERTVTTSYLVNGKPATVQQALEAALKEQSVTACRPVVATVSKAGTSIHLSPKKIAKNP